MGDLMGGGTVIGCGFRVARELRLRFARLADDGWGRCAGCGEWVMASAITTGGGHAVGGAPPDHCGPVEVRT